MLTIKSIFSLVLVLIGFFGITSCKKTNDTPLNPNPNPPLSADTTGPLKAVASFPIGIAIDYTLFKNNAVYKSTVVREADQVTFGNQMKHGAIVKDDGSMD